MSDFKLLCCFLATGFLAASVLSAGMLSVSQGKGALEPHAATFVWTWDRDEDLRFLPPDVGVAPVEASIELRGQRTAVRPRYTRLQVRADAQLLPVVHIDAAPSWRPALNSLQKEQIVETTVAVADRYGRRAVQMDFEALPSQRAFYFDVLQDLRTRLPGYRLSVTALASWCADPDLAWLKALPVDEVVAMPFRMGFDSAEWRRKLAGMPRWPNPACTATSRALDEPNLDGPVAARVFLFSPRPWTPEIWQPAARAQNQRKNILGALRTWWSQ